MSGICGLYRFNGHFIGQSELQQMTQAMASLGSDGSGVWQSSSVGFGHRAFHLTDDSINETLPYFDPLLKLAITTDCRLDNRTELCHRFGFKNEAGISDAVLILHAYRHWGQDCPQHLLGEFAVAIWDESQQALICFTDHTAQRSIYYYHDEHLFAFSSDINALHTLRGIDRKPNLECLAAQGNTAYYLNRIEITWYKNIFILSARTLLSVKNTHVQRHAYWQPDLDQRIHFSSEDEYIETFQNLFQTIVRDKLRSHCPVVTLYSGGLDSSAITAMASTILHHENKPLTALSAVLPPEYQGNTTDEQHYIHLLQKPNLQIQHITDTWRGPFDGLDDAQYFMSGPNKSSRYYLYKAFATKASAQGARIILDGCFGEKGPSFHGNGYFSELLLAGKWRTLLTESRLHVKRYDRSWKKFVAGELVMPCLPATLQAKLNLRSDLHFSQQLSFIKSNFRNAHISDTSIKNVGFMLNTQYPNHRRHQYQNMCYLNPNTAHLIHADHGQPIHFSYPYNDKRMLEFCLAIPGNLKVRNGYKRYAIRSGMRGLMPDALRFRLSKEPFSPDFHDRYNRQLEKAREFVTHFANTPLIQEIIDIKRLKSELDYPMQTNRCSTSRDFMSMHTIPSTIYLMAFLLTFA